MTDYRSISQVYAQEGIKASLLINAGAAVTLLTQAADLIAKEMASIVMWPMICWAVGIAISTTLWVFAFLSTRYVDKSFDEGREDHIATSNFWMFAAIGGFLLSVVAFVIGAVLLAVNLPD